MKPLLALVVCIAISNTNYCQALLGPEDVIRRITASSSIEGHDNKIIGGMGDAAAVLVTKVVAGGHLGSGEIDGVLTVLNMSFAGQARDASNQEPKTALFVLQYCDSATKDPELKKRIEQTKEYLQSYLHSQHHE